MLDSAPPLAQEPPSNVLPETTTGRSSNWSRTRRAAPPRSWPTAWQRLPVNREPITVSCPPRTNTAPPPPSAVVVPRALPSASTRSCRTRCGSSWSSQCDVVKPRSSSQVFW